MELTGWNRQTSPYHAAEQELQDRVGRKEVQDRIARSIHRPYMPDQHREFFGQLPFMIAGSVDSLGWPWASVLFGHPGFATSPNEKTLTINAKPFPTDPLSEGLVNGAPLGLIGIELHTRRRNRLNGVVTNRNDGSFDVNVVQSYGNCPQYIHTRAMEFVRDPVSPVSIETQTFSELDETITTVIRRSDTFFVASCNDKDDKYDTGGTDVSHRGGKPGFVKVEGNTLTIPDYVGNFAFNTLGNFLVNPKAGLLFVDFANGDIWQLTGTVELLWDKTEEIEAFRGAERAWRFHLHHGQCLKNASPLIWKTGEASPNALLTGSWEDASRALAANEKRKTWRPFRVTRVSDESAIVRSFYLEPADGDGIVDYQPGQFLTLRASPPTNQPEPVEQLIRTYTLSSAPSDSGYRISVKREEHGAFSQFLHDEIRVGDTIEALSPNGSFWLDTQEERPAVLFAGGIGVTPMIAMAREAVSNGVRRRYVRPMTVFHASQTVTDRAFAEEFTSLTRSSNNALRYVSLIGRPAQEETAGKHFHESGRVTLEVLQRYLPLDDYDYYLCGPAPFMQGIYDMLLSLGVRDARVFAESFGPSSLNRRSDSIIGRSEPAFDPVDAAVVTFEKSKFEQGWAIKDGTLLEFAEAHGLTPEFGCRSGACGSCAVQLISGKTGYKHQPTFQTEPDTVLLCCAVPAKSDEPLRIDL